MAIEVLPDTVVARIAAGEAVERPASVVKELIENAIDAGATALHIETVASGRELLRVSDNGAGIRQAEIALAFKRHATSKLRAAEDLQAILTLGFRGEALASIAAVSRTTIASRHREEEVGSRLRFEGGLLQHQQQVGAPAGTVLTIENLFYNTPARLKFLKSDNTEKRHIYWTVARYALAYPQIAFVLKQDERERFRSTGSGALADVVAKVFGLAAFKSMTPLQSAEPARLGRVPIEVGGYISLPPLSRGNRERIILFVNGRAIQDGRLSHAIVQAYDNLLKSGQYPLVLLLITVPADFVDVNVHPAKAEVRFRAGQQVFVAVQRAVREALLASDSPLPAAEDLWSKSGFGETYLEYQRPQPWPAAADAFFDQDAPGYLPDLAETPSKPRTLPVLRVVGQLGATYIIAEGPAGLYLLEQNAAHERLLFETMREELAAGPLPGLKLAESQTVLLAPEAAQLLEALAEIMAKLGFEIELFGPNTYVIRAVPACLASSPLTEALPEMLEQLQGAEQTEVAALAALASAAALRRGQILDQAQMAELVAQLERCPEPLISPSGRKTLIHLSRDQLAEEFQRA